jgi:dienelactone hydrolase
VTGQPRLVQTSAPRNPQGVVLVLHGGASRSDNIAVSPTQLSVLRMIPIAGRIARAGRRRLAVYRLLNSVRGWDSHHTPVQDARWAMAEIRRRLGADLPVCLVGHSLGGRAALLAADEPGVVSVAALAPWVYPNDGVGGLPGRRVMIVHGSDDRIAQPDRSAAVARNLAGHGPVSYVRVAGGKHAMLAHHNTFDGLAAQFAVATLLNTPTRGLIGQVMAGEEWLDA